MRILFVSPASVVHTIRWANSLCQRSHDVHVVCLRNHSEGANRLEGSVKVHYLPIGSPVGYLLNAPALRRLASKIKADIVNVHFASGYGTLARLAGLHPCVLSVWGSDVYDFPQRGLTRRMLLSANLNYADLVTSTSECMRRQALKYMDPAKRILVVPFGVDTMLFSKFPDESSRDTLVIGIIKTLKPKYGIDYLIRAFSQVRERAKSELGRQVRLVVYGGGPERKNLEELAESLGVSDAVEFPGTVKNTDVPNVLKGLDVFVVPSIRESFGVAAVEAMACEVPVVVSDAEGLQEVVVDGETGIVVPRHDSMALSNAIMRLLADSELRVEMGRRGRTRVKQMYEWDDNVNLMVEIYLATSKMAEQKNCAKLHP